MQDPRIARTPRLFSVLIAGLAVLLYGVTDGEDMRGQPSVLSACAQADALPRVGHVASEAGQWRSIALTHERTFVAQGQYIVEVAGDVLQRRVCIPDGIDEMAVGRERDRLYVLSGAGRLHWFDLDGVPRQFEMGRAYPVLFDASKLDAEGELIAVGSAMSGIQVLRDSSSEPRLVGRVEVEPISGDYIVDWRLHKGLLYVLAHRTDDGPGSPTAALTAYEVTEVGLVERGTKVFDEEYRSIEVDDSQIFLTIAHDGVDIYAIGNAEQVVAPADPYKWMEGEDIYRFAVADNVAAAATLDGGPRRHSTVRVFEYEGIDEGAAQYFEVLGAIEDMRVGQQSALVASEEGLHWMRLGEAEPTRIDNGPVQVMKVALDHKRMMILDSIDQVWLRDDVGQSAPFVLIGNLSEGGVELVVTSDDDALVARGLHVLEAGRLRETDEFVAERTFPFVVDEVGAIMHVMIDTGLYVVVSSITSRMADMNEVFITAITRAPVGGEWVRSNAVGFKGRVDPPYFLARASESRLIVLGAGEGPIELDVGPFPRIEARESAVFEAVPHGVVAVGDQLVVADGKEAVVLDLDGSGSSTVIARHALPYTVLDLVVSGERLWIVMDDDDDETNNWVVRLPLDQLTNDAFAVEQPIAIEAHLGQASASSLAVANISPWHGVTTYLEEREPDDRLFLPALRNDG